MRTLLLPVIPLINLTSLRYSEVSSIKSYKSLSSRYKRSATKERLCWQESVREYIEIMFLPIFQNMKNYKPEGKHKANKPHQFDKHLISSLSFLPDSCCCMDSKTLGYFWAADMGPLPNQKGWLVGHRLSPPIPKQNSISSTNSYILYITITALYYNHTRCETIKLKPYTPNFQLQRGHRNGRNLPIIINRIKS